MVCRPRTPYRRLFLLLWIALCCCASSCLAAQSHPKARKVTLAVNSAKNSFVQQCPRAAKRHPPLSQLKTIIDRTMPEQFQKAPHLPTCLGSTETCRQAGDPCSPGGMCAPYLTEHRLRTSRRLYLQHCPHLTLFSVMSSQDRRNLNDTTLCCSIGRHLVERDRLVESFLQQHRSLLNRSNFHDRCHLGRGVYGSDMCGGTPYGKCITCEEAYRRWVCSQLFVFYDGKGCPVEPCPSLCHCVEQNCPYFLPQDKPVAGEPSFLCGDPDVGMNNGVTSADSCNSRCYEPCPHNMSLGVLEEKTNVTDFALCIHRLETVKSCPKHPHGDNYQCLARPFYSSIRNCAVSVELALACTRTPVILLASLTLFLQLPRGYT